MQIFKIILNKGAIGALIFNINYCSVINKNSPLFANDSSSSIDSSCDTSVKEIIIVREKCRVSSLLSQQNQSSTSLQSEPTCENVPYPIVDEFLSYLHRELDCKCLYQNIDLIIENYTKYTVGSLLFCAAHNILKKLNSNIRPYAYLDKAHNSTMQYLSIEYNKYYLHLDIYTYLNEFYYRLSMRIGFKINKEYFILKELRVDFDTGGKMLSGPELTSYGTKR